MIRGAALVLLMVLLAPHAAGAQAPGAVETPEMWNQRETRRFMNQRRDCTAQWEGLERRGGTRGQNRETFIAECAEAAAIARCHPPGSNPTCLYLSRERRAGQPVPEN